MSKTKSEEAEGPPVLRIVAGWAVNACAFLAALAGACFAIDSALPSPRVFDLGQKFDHLAAHPEIDALFIGSSRLFHSVDPVLFDRDAAVLGVRTRSFNLAVDGMRPPESLYVARLALARHPGLRWVFIEAQDIFVKLPKQNLATARVVHWHDWRHTAMVLREIRTRLARTPGARGLVGLHLRCFAQRTSNVGRGADIVAGRLRWVKKSAASEPLWAGREGFVPDTHPWADAKLRARYALAVETIRATPPAPAPLTPVLRGAFRDVAAEVRAAGATPIFVVTPTVLAREQFGALRAQGVDADLIGFYAPDAQPELFDAALHNDAGSSLPELDTVERAQSRRKVLRRPAQGNAGLRICLVR